MSNINESLNNDDINLQKTKKSSVCNIIGDYFNSTEATLLFCPQDDESVEDCLSRRIDVFDDILNNKIDVSFIVNRACEKNCELNINQTINIRQRIQYLRMAYFNVLESDLDQPIMFKFCCEKAIQQLSEMGIKIIRNFKSIMQWNRIFRTHEMFPHPNY